ncbi:MAG: DNA mismatch repair endonuclease MutL [Bacteroidales bacterium]|jgi:DNA mismatch repair protein MutL|nr:DNA mismatch repair endonuclease MutL [Bacteroidales bacterium]
MSDIIKLLPESVANQIAAGEVVQRPASVVKELLENAVDSGASSIDLVVKDSGKTLIQVVDNGRGMSVADARMAFERHATSKICRAEDLFAIHSFGFRGEALASIASVARVEMKTRDEVSEAGISIVIEGSKFISQEICAAPQGTNIQVKDLFFNIPARRQFLKSDNAEMHHIWDEIHRVAIPNHHIRFRIFEGSRILSTHEPSNLQQRIVSLFGKQYQQRLMSVSQDTQYVRVSGVVIRPEFSKKTRGEQFLFVNNRFIRSNYINAAIKNAYQGLIPADAFPGYFIFIEVDPAEIDINIHPTKTEIKFRDERMIATLITSTIRRSLGTGNAMPSIDFEVEQGIDFSLNPDREVKIPQIKVNPEFNPFRNSVQPIDYTSAERSRLHWENDTIPSPDPLPEDTLPDQFVPQNETFNAESYIQAGRRFIISNVKSGLLLVDQHQASLRIVFDQLVNYGHHESKNARLLMFPENISFGAADSELMAAISDELNNCGFVISQLGRDMFSVSAVPDDVELNGISVKQLLEGVLEDYKSAGALRTDRRESVILSMARKLSVRHGQFLNSEMMKLMISKLFASSNPEISPEGKNIFTIVSADDLAKWLH